MAGYEDVLEIDRLRQECDQLGFKWGYPKYHNSDKIALYPKDHDALPVYSRDAEMFVGTISELRVWLRGVHWARIYDRMTIGKSIDINRARKEQDWRNKNLVRKLTEE